MQSIEYEKWLLLSITFITSHSLSTAHAARMQADLLFQIQLYEIIAFTDTGNFKNLKIEISIKLLASA